MWWTGTYDQGAVTVNLNRYHQIAGCSRGAADLDAQALRPAAIARVKEQGVNTGLEAVGNGKGRPSVEKSFVVREAVVDTGAVAVDQDVEHLVIGHELSAEDGCPRHESGQVKSELVVVK